jgi:hypothetical protein
MSEVIEIPAKAELDRHFSAMGDSVSLIEGPNQVITKNDESKATVERNVGHLKLMRDKPWWDGYDLTAVNAAITAGDAYCA